MTSSTCEKWFVAVIAAVFAATSGYAFENQSCQISELGTYVKESKGRLAKITPSTKYLNAEHFETLTIENQKGQRFSWQFDTRYAPTGFLLRRIAPAGFESGDTWVYINHPPRHVATD